MQVDQVGRQHVHVDHAGEGFGLVPGLLAQPVGSVVHDGAQALGVLLELVDEGEDAGFAGEVGRQGQRAALAQLVERRTLRAVADDQRLAGVEQAPRTVQPDPLAGAGDQDGGG
ncbi:hypothetical protein D3C78_1153980 [compost metagenome]